jgi:hypothetical protein
LALLPAPTQPLEPNAAVAVLDRYFANAPDIYRRKLNPQTGAVTLSAHFPELARIRYAEALAAASHEIGAPVTISDEPHQQMLAAAAREALPPGVEALKTSIHVPRRAVVIHVSGETNEAALAEAAKQFHVRTGWELEIVRGTA